MIIKKQIPSARLVDYIEFTVNVIEQFGCLSDDGKYYFDGGLSTLEDGLELLWKQKIAKRPDRLTVFEIRKYWRSR